MKILAFIALLQLAAVPVFSAGNSTAAGVFLSQDPSARVFALGGVALPLVNDPAAAWVNPALLGHMTGHNIAVSAWKGLDAVSNYNSAFVGLRAGRAGAFSLGYMGYDSGSEEIYDVDGGVRNVVLQKDYAVSAGWGHNLGERLFFGAQAKSVSSSLAEEYKANTLSFDGGLAYKSLDDRFTLGLAARNFGGELKYKSEADPLPQTIAVGAGYKMDAGPAKLALGVEAVKQADAESPYGALGAEYELPGFPVALRAALRHFDKEVLFAAGLGVSLKGIALDYGFQPAGELGEAGHRFTLRLAFGPVDDAARALAYRELGLKRKALAMGYSYTGPKITVSVLQPEIGAGVTAEEGAAVADALRSGMGRSPELQLIAREQTEQILKEQHFQYSICGAADCAVEAGKLLGVRKIIGVSMMRIGSRYTLTIRSIDVETGAQDYSFTETAGSAEGLYDLAVKFADRIALGE